MISLTQLGDVLVHLINSEVQDLPEMRGGEVRRHLLGEQPSGHGTALHDLGLQHFVHEHGDHLRVALPELPDVAEDTDLGFLGFC